MLGFQDEGAALIEVYAKSDGARRHRHFARDRAKRDRGAGYRAHRKARKKSRVIGALLAAVAGEVQRAMNESRSADGMISVW